MGVAVTLLIDDIGVQRYSVRSPIVYTDKKEKKIFLIFKEIQIRPVAKSNYEEGLPFLTYEKMRDFATAPV